MQDGDYRTAIRDFDTFLTSHPEHPRRRQKRVLHALANVRQYISISGGYVVDCPEAAQEMYRQVPADPEFRDEQVELAELVIRIGEVLADRDATRPMRRSCKRRNRPLLCTPGLPENRHRRS